MLIMLLMVVGCSGGPAAVEMPNFDPDGAAEQALVLYDTDKDGFVAGEELENAPSLRAAIKTLDADKDGRVSEEEIANRIRSWEKRGFGLMTIVCEATLNNRPLGETTITFEPEEFLGGVIQEARGVTSGLGSAYLAIPKEKRPTPDTPPGMQAGFYKVRISKIVDGKETIPSQYNTETILGQQISLDDPAILNKQLRFNLKSK